MNIKELLETKHEHEYIDTDLYGLSSDVDCHTNSSDWDTEDPSLLRVHKRVIKNHSYDGRRIWYLAVLVFDSISVAVIQKAGRDGKDWSRTLVINKKSYVQACKYLDSLCEYDVPEAINSETIVDDFYNQSLSEPFERY